MILGEITIYVGGAVALFFAVTDRLHGDCDLRRDALLAREVLAGAEPVTEVTTEAAESVYAAALPVDGAGRTLPGWVTNDGVLGRDLWERFARTELELVFDHELWERSGHGEEEVETSHPRIHVDAIQADGAWQTARLSATWPGYAPDPLAELVTTKLEAGSVPWHACWPEPFAQLFPGVAALEALVEQSTLRRVLSLASQGRRREALATAETALGQRRYEVTLPSLGVFWEIARGHDGEESVLMDAEGALGIEAPDWETLTSNERFLEVLRRPTVMPFLVGVLGYIWWQVVAALREGHVPRSCEACVRLLPGHVTARRRFCSNAENPSCWRDRHRRRMRGRRADHW